MDELYQDLAEALEVDEVHPEDVLQDFESWDSLTALGIVALLDGKYGVNFSAQDLRTAGTIGGLAALVQQQKGQ